jgi:hypothetical protein
MGPLRGAHAEASASLGGSVLHGTERIGDGCVRSVLPQRVGVLVDNRVVRSLRVAYGALHR